MSAVATSLPAGQVRSLVRGLTRRIPGTRTQRVGNPGVSPGWRAYLIHTRSGQIGPGLDPVSGSWEIVLNGIESVTMTVRKRDLAGIERRWYSPWWGGVLLSFSDGAVETPVIAGPITGWGTENENSLQIKAKGLREIYRRLVLEEDLSPRDVSLGEIMWQLAKAPASKPGGGLPVVDGCPDPHGRGHQRSYEAWNLANTGLDKLMSELSNVIGGPDVMFRPRVQKGDPRFLEWVVEHGTHLSPRIETGPIHDFDTTAVRAAVQEITVTTDASALVSRVWATGSGEGEGTRIARAEDLSLVKAGFPFLETVISNPGTTTAPAAAASGEAGVRQEVPAGEELAKLAGLAQGELAARVDAVDQITVKVPVDHPTRGVDRLRVGDAAHVTVAGWLAVPDGTLRTRVVKLGGDLTGMMTVDFQEDSWI